MRATSLKTASRQNRTSGAGTHTQPEAMDLGPAAVIRLKSPLTHDKSPSYFGEAIQAKEPDGRTMLTTGSDHAHCLGTHDRPMVRRINATLFTILSQTRTPVQERPPCRLSRLDIRKLIFDCTQRRPTR